jgi:hypothetical protein
VPAQLAVILLALTLATGCQALLSPEPTPVPGAAATLTRSSRTPIPTPVRVASPSAAPSAQLARSPVAVASPARAGHEVTQDDIDQLRRQMENIVSTADLPNVEELLLDRVSLATPAGGQVLDRHAAAQWLREHAGSGIKVVRVDPNTQTVLLEVETEGWPIKDPLEQGRVTFNLRRYSPDGRQDEENGDWKIDVMAAE